MKTARYIVEGTTHIVTPRNYREDVHKGHLQCADAGCSATVHFVKQHASHGGSFHINSHFATDPNSEHKKACPEIQYDMVPRNSVDVKDAARKGFPVVLHINMELGHPDYQRFHNVYSSPVNNEYTRLLKQRHGSITIKNIRDLFHAEAKLKEMDADMTHVFAAHVMQVRNYDGLMIDRQNSRNLFFQARKATNEKRTAYGFPRLLTFQPTKQSMQTREFAQSYGGILKKDAAGHEIILLNNLLFTGDKEGFDLAFEKSRCAVLAVPSFNATQEANARRQFNEGNTAYVHIDWEIISPELQILPLEDVPQEKSGRTTLPEHNFEFAI